ncbi:MAG: amino acid ABC transporter substrate-binding protein [Hydrogenophaga sp.]|jgi:general L-amino acid transport system substrate-binding protein|uniref:amino acid ABC transporter substrate-binding protein n=1 Tax=Hydrogenophaga sp. TaxID=1904254 RepID=UPI00260DFC75|nr:amino acid ABC transporter substrate-binding protein [Hydrogenophaga sp.]MCV0437123.1 amino acid ABC transporter substrate-binding protein [Hydrogenophaga sp.]
MKMSSKTLTAVALSAVATLVSLPAHAGKDLDAIKKRGELICGVSTGLAGFSAADSQGKWSGLDVDVCRSVAAAVLNDSTKVRYVPLNAAQRFTALQSGEVDLLPRNTTWTLTRDASLGLHFTGVNFYDGQGFMVPKSLNVKSAKDLKGATVCVQAGTTTELNMSDYSRANNLNLRPIVFAELAATNAAYFAGRCQAYTTDASGLASIRSKEAAKPDDHMILPELISKEPLGPAVRRGDDEFFAIVKWIGYALLEAEELGITAANVDTMKKDSKNPSVMRLLGGGTEDTGKLLGLDKDWAVRAIKAVGNYGESYERNITPIGLPRGVNALWNKGGLMYPMPIR